MDSLCKQTSNLDYVLIQAEDTTRHVGYPYNVGLRYCYTCGLKLDFVCFLDDDDILYPFFTQKMWQAFITTQADVVYASSNRRELGSQAAEGYRPKHVSYLFIENFIPVNSYAVRLKSLREKQVFTEEDMLSTEDWLFLLRLLENGFRFEPLQETVSEFRITSDGNILEKRQPEIWKKASLRIRSYINKSDFSINGYVLASSVMSIDPRLPAGDTQVTSLQCQVENLEAYLAGVVKEKEQLETELVHWQQKAQKLPVKIWMAFQTALKKVGNV